MAPAATTVTSFTRNLIELLRSGVTLVDAFQLMAADGRSVQGRMALQIHKNLRQGVTFISILKKYPRWFDAMYLHMAEAGYRTGQLDVFLNILAEYRESKESVRRKVIRAVTYPAFVLLVAVVLSVILLVQILPRFSHLFESAGDGLPYLTVVMISASEFLIEYGMFVLLGIFILVLIYRYSLPLMRDHWHNVSLYVPGIRRWRIYRIKESYLRSLSVLLQAGIPLVEASTIAANGCRYRSFKRELLTVPSHIIRGQTLDQAWKSISWFHPADILAAHTGGKGADLRQLLQLRAYYYQKKIESNLQLMLQLLEPILMLVIGGVIGVIVLAVYLPLFSIGQVL